MDKYVILKNTGLTYEAGVRPLNISDAPACEIVENDAFTDPRYRATREKFDYRLTHYSEICYGLFIKAKPTDLLFGQAIPTASLSKTPGEQWLLVAHIIGSRSMNPKVSDEDMVAPEGWKEWTIARPGTTSAVHSFTVVQALQNKGIGRKFMKFYVESMTARADVDSIALLCQDHLFEMYKSMGYLPAEGKSLATFGGGGWNDMVQATMNE